jgi:hypothetical protein
LLPLLSCIPDDVFAPTATKTAATASSKPSAGAAAAASFFGGGVASSSAASAKQPAAATPSSANADSAARAELLAAFVEKFTENVWLGLGATLLSSDGARSLLSAYAECLHHGVLRVSWAAAAAQAPGLVEHLLQAQALPLLRSMLLAPPTHLLSAPDAASDSQQQHNPAEQWSQHPLACAALLVKCPFGMVWSLLFLRLLWSDFIPVLFSTYLHISECRLLFRRNRQAFGADHSPFSRCQFCCFAGYCAGCGESPVSRVAATNPRPGKRYSQHGGRSALLEQYLPSWILFFSVSLSHQFSFITLASACSSFAAASRWSGCLAIAFVSRRCRVGQHARADRHVYSF